MISWSRTWCCLPLHALPWIACHTRSGVAGMSSLLLPIASVMALMTAGGRADRAGLAAALDAERIARAQRRGVRQLERRQVVGARHGVVHERRRHELAAVVVDRAFQQRLADALGEAAMDLALDDHRVDQPAEIVGRDEVDEVGLAGAGIDLDLADVGAGREGEVGRIVERAFPSGRAPCRRADCARCRRRAPPSAARSTCRCR